jgi:hypothetical protein
MLMQEAARLFGPARLHQDLDRDERRKEMPEGAVMDAPRQAWDVGALEQGQRPVYGIEAVLRPNRNEFAVSSSGLDLCGHVEPDRDEHHGGDEIQTTHTGRSLEKAA